MLHRQLPLPRNNINRAQFLNFFLMLTFNLIPCFPIVAIITNCKLQWLKMTDSFPFSCFCFSWYLLIGVYLFLYTRGVMVYKCMCTHAWMHSRVETRSRYCYQLFFRQGLSLNLKLAHLAKRLTSKPSDPLTSASNAGIINMIITAVLSFLFMGAGDPDSGSHVCTASPSLMDPLPGLWIF